MNLLYNARIYTFDTQLAIVSALAIHGERVIAYGDAQSLRAEWGGKLESFDLQGRVIIPGLTDAHIHLEWYAMGLQKVDCETPTKAECLRRVAKRARHLPEGTWILGHGWNQNDWSEGFGTASDLDAVAPRHPVYLTARSLHAGWANTQALRIAGINAMTPDPADGRLGRNAQGEPDGILFESAMELVQAAIPEPTVEGVAWAIREAQPFLWKMGVTGVHDFDRRRCFAALQILHERGELKLRVLKSIPLEDLSHAVALGLRSGLGDDFLRIGSVKVFADGALGPHTAAMFQPYEGEPENQGMLFLDAEQLFEQGRLAVENGLSLAVHAIGDRANHEVLNAFERLRQLEGWGAESAGTPQGSGKGGAAGLRHRIEHVQVLHAQDVGRLASLNVIASMQPIHATSDMNMAERYWGERAALSYAWRTQLQHGAVLAFGSDAPVESPNPFWGVHAAVTRQRADGSPGTEGWHPEQRLTVGEALQAYTTGAAYAAGMERRLGKLAPGYLADLLVLETDPLQCEPDQLRQIQPVAAMVGGKWAFIELA